MFFSIKTFFNQNKFLPAHLMVIIAFTLIYMMMSPSRMEQMKIKKTILILLILYIIQQ